MAWFEKALTIVTGGSAGPSDAAGGGSFGASDGGLSSGLSCIGLGGGLETSELHTQLLWYESHFSQGEPALRRAGPYGSSRPNILFLMADEMDGRILDPSSPQTKPPMPNLNRLAASGALFTGPVPRSAAAQHF